ncbi:hypothetical protein SY87_19400 [Burkholderia pseudomallei]|nr:hypothetical protein SY87_19400 [Burkholderia pseudomallei]
MLAQPVEVSQPTRVKAHVIVDNSDRLVRRVRRCIMQSRRRWHSHSGIDGDIPFIGKLEVYRFARTHADDPAADRFDRIAQTAHEVD